MFGTEAFNCVAVCRVSRRLRESGVELRTGVMRRVAQLINSHVTLYRSTKCLDKLNLESEDLYFL